MKIEIVDEKLVIEDEQLGNKLPEIIQALNKILRENKSDDVSKLSNVISDEICNLEKETEAILSLDVNKDEDIKAYANLLHLSEKGVKEILILHQNDIKENIIDKISRKLIIQTFTDVLKKGFNY